MTRPHSEPRLEKGVHHRHTSTPEPALHNTQHAAHTRVLATPVRTQVLHSLTHSRCFKCHSATRHSQAPKPCMCACAATAVFAAGRARVDRNFPFIPRWCRPLRYFASDGVYPVPVDSENTPSADLGAWQRRVHGVRSAGDRCGRWYGCSGRGYYGSKDTPYVDMVAHLLSPVPSRSSFSRLVRFPPLFLPFFLSGCSLFMVYSFSIARGKMLSAELRPISGVCPTMNSRTVDFGISCSSGSMVFESVCDHDDLDATAVLLWSALRAHRDAWKLRASGTVGRCKRARSCESASSGASQNSFSIMGQGDPCTLF